jgi:cellobiose-specific phosphotransferase system component IIC
MLWLAALMALLCTIVIWYFLAKPAAVDHQKIAAIALSCQIAMSRDVCGVMKASKAQSTQGRLFIAGIGEVDAQAFDRLQRAGEGMCQEVAEQCRTDWSGNACRIAQAMYPI